MPLFLLAFKKNYFFLIKFIGVTLVSPDFLKKVISWKFRPQMTQTLVKVIWATLIVEVRKCCLCK